MLFKAWILTAGKKWSLSAQHLGSHLASVCSSILVVPDSGQQHPWEHRDSFTHAWALPPLGTTPARLLCICSMFSLYVFIYLSNKVLCWEWGGLRSSRRRADPNTCCLCAWLGAALGFPKQNPIPTGVTEVLLLFYHLHMHHSVFFLLQGYGVVYFFSPEGSQYFQQGVCVFSAHSSFQTHKCPSLPGYGGSGGRGGGCGKGGHSPDGCLHHSWRSQALHPATAEQGPPYTNGVSPGVSLEPCNAQRKGVQPGWGEDTHPPAVPAKPA